MRHRFQLTFLPLFVVGVAACAAPAPVVLVPEPPRIVVGGAAREPEAPRALEAAVDGSRVVLVGEAHDRRPHHEFQRDVLARMASRPGPVLLGMEMFQRPFQQHLDDYVAGKIDEAEMLRRTEYYQIAAGAGPAEGRWNMDHTMYAPLWRLCRERGFRVVALNPAKEVHQKLRKEGIDALTPEERAGLAADIDLTVEAHRKRMLDVLQRVHPSPPAVAERFYAAQTAWDETMAESAANALAEAGPESRMLVVAGSQHIQEYTGVPARLAKRVPGLEPLVLVCRVCGMDEDGETTPAQLGHFVVATAPGTLPEAPRLGVGIGAATEKGLPITAVTETGLAAKAGIVAGDVVTTLGLEGAEPVRLRDFTDFKYMLCEAHFRGAKLVAGGEHADGTTFSVAIDLRAAEPDAPAAAPAPVPVAVPAAQP